MAEFYCDLGALTSGDYQAYAANMSIGALATDRPKPMDGCGMTADSTAARVSIAELQITTNPTAGNALSIGGSASITAVSAYTAKNQFLIGVDAAATTTNLITCLNTFGTATNAPNCDVTVAAAVSQLLLAVPYMYWARLKPGTTDTIQLFTRSACTALNTNVNSTSKVAQTGTWLNAGATSIDFTEGVHGPFAYLVNNSTMFGKTAGNYGLFFAAANSPANPGMTDVVHCRSKRSGTNLTAALWNNNVSYTWQSRNYLFDNGTVWAGDNGCLVFDWRNTGNSSLTMTGTVTGALTIASKGFGNFDLQMYANVSVQAISYAFVLVSASRLRFIKCLSTEVASLSVTQFITDRGNTANGAQVDISGSKFTYLATVKQLYRLENSNSRTCLLKMNGTTVVVQSASGPLGKFILLPNSFEAPNVIEWIGGSVLDSNGVFKCAMPVSVPVTAYMQIVLDGVAGVSDPTIGFTSVPTVALLSRLIWSQTEGPEKGYRIETPYCVTDWKNATGFPHCGAQNLQGDYWSHRVTWGLLPTVTAPVTPVRLGYFYRSAAAVKTITAEIYTPDAAGLFAHELGITVAYIDSTSVCRTEIIEPGVSAFLASPPALTASAKVWTPNGVAGFSAKKLELTTAYPIKQNSEITVTIALYASKASAIIFYVSPELGVA